MIHSARRVSCPTAASVAAPKCRRPSPAPHASWPLPGAGHVSYRPGLHTHSWPSADPGHSAGAPIASRRRDRALRHAPSGAIAGTPTAVLTDTPHGAVAAVTATRPHGAIAAPVGSCRLAPIASETHIVRSVVPSVSRIALSPSLSRAGPHLTTRPGAAVKYRCSDVVQDGTRGAGNVQVSHGNRAPLTGADRRRRRGRDLHDNVG
jgi:hypothetical protein